MYSPQHSTLSLDRKTALTLAMQRLYRQAAWRGKLRRFWSFFTERPTDLLTLSAMSRLFVVQNRYYAGIQTIPIEKIGGTEARTGEFDNRFTPRQNHLEERWINLAAAWADGACIPPIDVILVGEVYFVRDGHHRVSIARAMGRTFIDADVTVWHIAGKRKPVRQKPMSHRRWSFGPGFDTGIGFRYQRPLCWHQTLS